MKKEKKEEEVDKALLFFRGDDLAAKVWHSKYKFGDEKTPEDMFKRHVNEVKLIEKDRLDIMNNIVDVDMVSKLSPFGWNFVNAYMRGDVDFLPEMLNFNKIVLGGSMLQGIGNHKLYSSLSNCFVLGQPFDSYSGINKKEDETTQVMKRRGGAGLDLSTIRPEGAKIHNQATFSSGPVLFAEGYSNKTKQVAQMGRRGAEMLSLSILHPDSLGWIKAKQDLSCITGANISVKIPDEFMEAVEAENDTIVLRFPVETPLHMFSIDEIESMPFDETITNNTLYNGKPVMLRKVHAREYWQTIIDCAWSTAEPGIIFEGNWEKGGLDYIYPQYRPVSTNPCSEIPMQPYDACRLLSANIFKLVKNPFTPKAHIDSDEVYRMFYLQVWIGDYLVDLETQYIDRIIGKIRSEECPSGLTTCEATTQEADFYELQNSEVALWKKIKTTALSGRRIGAGFLAMGDMLAALGLPYYSPEMIAMVFKIKMEAELDATIDLAVLFGAFEGFDPELEKQSPYNKNVISVEFPVQYERMLKYGRRNISWSTAAPTGSLAIETQTTSGIEPCFLPFYKRRKKVISADERVDYIDPADGQKFTEFFVLHQPFIDWYHKQCVVSYDTCKEFLINCNETELQEIFKTSPWFGSCANDLKWEERVEIQSIVQKYTTHAISSTINLPNDVKKEIVGQIYLASWKGGLKGNTVYRDGCRGGVMVTANPVKKIENNESDFTPLKSIKRPLILPGNYHTIRTGKKVYSVIIGLMNGSPYEIFILSGAEELNLPQVFDETDHIAGEIVKDYKDWYNFESEFFNIKELTDMQKDEKLISMMLSGLLRQRTPLKNVIKIIEKTKPFAGSFNHKLVKILSKYIPDGVIESEKCPECGGQMHHENGCVLCKTCGWSKC